MGHYVFRKRNGKNRTSVAAAGLRKLRPIMLTRLASENQLDSPPPLLPTAHVHGALLSSSCDAVAGKLASLASCCDSADSLCRQHTHTHTHTHHHTVVHD